MAEASEGSTELKPREYQSMLLEICIKQNTILYLPTGSGKTYVAVMLIKYMSGDLKETIQNGGKRTFFLVNTVALVSQQAAYLSRHTPLSVGQFSGDMNVDYWKQAKWLQQLNMFEAVVMTVDIFRDILHHSYISLKNINLIVFDECHHGVCSHSMALVMKEFKDWPVEEQPRVIGLTATILNSDCSLDKVIFEVKNLEKTYLSKIVTVEDSALINEYATAPVEYLHPFSATCRTPLAERVCANIEDVNHFVMSVKLNIDAESLHVPPGTVPMIDFRKVNKKLRNAMVDVTYHLTHLGIYGGSVATIKHIIQLERIKRVADDSNLLLLLNCMITTLTMVRKLLEDHMLDCDEKNRIYKYSTPKVLKLFQILRGMEPGPEKEALCGIVFVERRFTAKVLYLILKYLSQYDSSFDFLKPDFVVGFQNNPFNCTREGYLEKKWNEEALARFKSGKTNLICSSDVLEEGIDVSQCNMVVKFDLPKSYRSYIQSKGRARKKPSSYMIMVPQDDFSKFDKKYRNYQRIEDYLKTILTCKAGGLDDETDEVNGEDDEAYIVEKGDIFAKVTMNSAIPLVNRYCSILPQDKFTVLTPVFFLKMDIGPGGYQCLLQLPINSPVKELIEGELKNNRKLAKQSVALETCKLLHKVGELDDHLLPRGRNVTTLHDESLFPNWEREKVEKDKPRPGTKKKKRIHPKKVPDSLTNCAPQAGIPVYLHVIEINPVNDWPAVEDTRRLAFRQLLEHTQEFAILSSKKMLKIPNFPIFLNVGELAINVKCNHQELILTEEEIFRLKRFNTMIFCSVLDICQSFMLVDFGNEENSFLMVPVWLPPHGVYEIDWTTVSHQEIPAVAPPSEEVRSNIRVTHEGYYLTVVTPWYRSHSSDQRYVVTRICDNMTPLSDFPTEEFNSFEHYYDVKYNLTVMCHDQPLIEVKTISSKLNCLKPRGQGGHTVSKRRRKEMQEDFEEHFIPELCYQYTFPAVFWLKSTCLPSILHRITQLLLAEELRIRIAWDLGFVIREDVDFKPLSVDPVCLETSEPSNSTAQTSTLVIPKLIHLKENVVQSLGPCPWGDEPEPVDIDRELLEEITLMDVFLYDDFINKPLEPKKERTTTNSSEADNERYVKQKRKCALDDAFAPCPCPINILQATKFDHGPQTCHIMQALTTASANDIVDMERLETLGDTFLKFSVSLFLFTCFSSLDEGKLTEMKGKMVGNRNLYYCGKARGISHIIKAHDFSPRNDWMPPGFRVPQELLDWLKDPNKNLCPSLLYEVDVPKENRLNGMLSPEFLSQLKAQMLEWDRENTFVSGAESFIGMQSIADKNIADSVEALIGTYLKGYGVEGAAKLLSWFKIIPPEKINIEELYFGRPVTAYVASPNSKPEDVNFHLKPSEVQKLEEILGYRFKDPSYLLQALTHPSYVQNRVTDCYQRLEFLGDAILDFLITCHIFETCGNLTPGQLTDLRSALVNNITFGCLAVRNGFHKYLKYESVKLFDKIDVFVKYQENHDHEVNEKILYLLEEDDCMLAEAIDVPKVLGDTFESVSAAIYLDSGKNLQEVWRVVYQLMKNEIHAFSKSVPKHPVRMLHELCPSFDFKESKQLGESGVIMVTLEVLVGSQKKHQFHGFGNNKTNAKRAAAKLALKHLIDSGF